MDCSAIEKVVLHEGERLDEEQVVSETRAIPSAPRQNILSHLSSLEKIHITENLRLSLAFFDGLVMLPFPPLLFCVYKYEKLEKNQ